jgi:hypothetical protein
MEINMETRTGPYTFNQGFEDRFACDINQRIDFDIDFVLAYTCPRGAH